MLKPKTECTFASAQAAAAARWSSTQLVAWAEHSGETILESIELIKPKPYWGQLWLMIGPGRSQASREGDMVEFN